MQLAAGDDAFVVDEIPSYGPAGDGEHLYLQLRKRNLTTPALVSAIARCCRVQPRDVGYAGRKDRHGITSQALTVYRGQETDLQHLHEHLPSDCSVEILSLSRHRNKLRIGHLRGNAFRLRIENPAADLPQRLSECMARGILNTYGEQRYGRDGANLQRAQAVARAEIRAPRDRRQREYLADAGQATIFDAVIAARAAAGLLRSLRCGDVAILPNGACFVVSADDLAASGSANLQQRLNNGEIGCSGPLPGASLLQAGEPSASDEIAWSSAVGIPWSCFSRGGPLASSGSRRQGLMPILEQPCLGAVEHDSAGNTQAWLSVSLGPGAYATSMLQQLGIGGRAS